VPEPVESDVNETNPPTQTVRRTGPVDGMRQRNYRVDRGGSLDYLRAAAQAVGVSPASR
jgi:hypothetical protein